MAILRLLHPEWQGYGIHAESHAGAQALAAAWFAGEPVTAIDAPVGEALQIEQNVLGLSSIAARFKHALDVIGQHAPEQILMAAGTCGCELAPVAYLNDRYDGDLTVLWLDGHADLNTPRLSPSCHFHGMVLRTLLGEGPEVLTRDIPRLLTPSQVALVGARDIDPAEADYIASAPIMHFNNDAFADPSPLIDWLNREGRRRLCIHFDVDVLDRRDFEGALMRAEGEGPTLGAAASLISHLHRQFDVVGFSVLEVCDRGDAIERLAKAISFLR